MRATREGSTACTSGQYAQKHNPWFAFKNVPLTTGKTWAQFPKGDFTALPHLSFVVPNQCNDMHSCAVATGDTWLRNNLDAYAQWAKANNSLLVLLLVLFVRDTSVGKAERAAASRTRHPRRALRTLARTRGLPRLCLIAALLGVVTVSDSFLYLLLQRRIDLPAPYFPLLPVGAAAGFLLLAVPLGRIADRIGRRQVFLAGHGALLSAYLLLLAPWGGGLVAAGCVLVLLGAFYAATDGVLMAAAGPLLPPHLKASGLALVQSAQAFARFGGSLLFGAGWMYFGPHGALTVAAAGLVVALAAVATLHRGRRA